MTSHLKDDIEKAIRRALCSVCKRVKALWPGGPCEDCHTETGGSG